ncbi:LysR family transcriptional regulator [Paraburkholderia sp. RL17-337-BIB-A]|uniref:LysR family transcriptional regulator n=1 Tax=Paraburkholderia sp. RL17-337-BIB-A TaxID=3031636 RepID=UPI0038B8DE8D
MNITLRQLRALVAVSRLESFTKAAELLHVTQPALTVQVRQLEEALDLKLLDRTTRQVKLTEAGKDIVPILQTLLRELDSVVSRSKDLSSKRAGSIRLGCLPSVAVSVLPLAIAAFRERFPNVSFVLADGLGKRIVQDVRQETIEFGITDVDLGAPDLASVWLFDETMHVFYPRDHPIARSRAITVEELAKYPIILMAPESNARTAVDLAFANRDRRPNAGCEVVYMSTAIGMVRAGLGITVLPPMAVQSETAPDLGSRPVDDPAFIRRIAVVTKADRSLSPAAAAFVDILQVTVKHRRSSRGRP